MKNIKVEYKSHKFTIKEKSNHYHLDFYINGKRIKRTTGLEANASNLLEIKNIIIPQLVNEFNSSNTTGNEKTDSKKLASKTTVNDFAKVYFALYKEQVRPHVFKRNISNYNNHIAPYFGSKTLDSIKPMELELWQNKLLKKVKPLTAQKYRSILFGILESAVKNELITKNPLKLVTSPKFNIRNSFNNSHKIHPFTKSEINKILDNDDNFYMMNFIKLMYNTGMRPGEMIALTWDDIDFKKRTININKTIVAGKLGLPKTQSSIRIIDMLDDAYNALQNQYKLTSDNSHVFISRNHKPFFSHDIINTNFKLLLSKHNIEERPLYQLRHSFASRMVSKGIDVLWISNTLGHKDVSITLNTYSKFIKEDETVRLRNIEKISSMVS